MDGGRWGTIEVSTYNWLSQKPVFLGEPRPNLHARDLIDSATMQWDRDKNQLGSCHLGLQMEQKA